MLSPQNLSGQRILVVEDDYYVATELMSRLAAIDVRVVGPSPNIEDALEHIRGDPDLDGAILDINLGAEMVFPVADELQRLGLPFVFVTGYAPEIVPARYADKILLRKPLEHDAIAPALTAATHRERVSIDEAAKNGILRRLSERALLQTLPFLHRVHLPRGAVMEVPRQAVNRVYFPITCVASLIAVGRDGTRIETGLIGREGITGVGLTIGDNRTAHELINQVEGLALAMAADDFLTVLSVNPDLGLLANRFARSLAVQVSHTALANGTLEIRRRLARWLLMVQDRVAGDAFDLTHDYLAVMLGVRRPSVTDALHFLEGERLIRSKRSYIEIRDRAALKAYAEPAYGIPEEELERLMALPIEASSAKADNRTVQAVGQ